MAERLAAYGDLMTTRVTGVTRDGQKIEVPALSNLRNQIRDLEAYGAALEALKERGISESLMSEVLSMSTEDALEYSELLLSQSDRNWDAYMQQWEEKQALAKQIAENYYAEEMESLETEYADKLQAGLDGLKDLSYASGVDTAQGLLEGMRSGEGEIYAAAQEIADNVIATLQSALQIHSPSKLMRDKVGLMIPEGVADGIKAGIGDAAQQAEHMSERIQKAANIQPDVLGAQSAVMARLKSTVEGEVLRVSAGLSIASNAPVEARRAARADQAVQTAGMLAAASAVNGQVESAVYLNGVEVGRAILHDLRYTEDQSPRIVSDRV